MNNTVSTAALALLATGLLAGHAQAQVSVQSPTRDPQQVRIRTFEGPNVMSFSTLSPNRVVIGVGLATGSLADTLGLAVADVTPNGPAAAAGIMEGSRLQAINGVSLRISADDARDPLTADAGYRRLQRELGERTAGDKVTLRVLANGTARDVAVTTVAASALATVGTRTLTSGMWPARAPRAVLGIGIGSAGNPRDTLGVFITSVRTEGPADKAGIIEGERIAEINGVDVRVPREDADVPSAASARLSRFQREMDKVAPGESVSLRVYTNGRYRSVSVRADSASAFRAVNLPMLLDDMRFDLRGGAADQDSGAAPQVFLRSGEGGGVYRVRVAPRSAAPSAAEPASVRVMTRRSGS